MSGYTVFDNEFADESDLKMSERMVLIMLISYYNKKKGYAYPSYENLKRRTGINSDATLSKSLKVLENKEFIKKEVIKGKGTKYFILQGLHNKMIKTNEPIKENEKESNISDEEYYDNMF